MKRLHNMKYCICLRSVPCALRVAHDDPHWRRRVTDSDDLHLQLVFLFLIGSIECVKQPTIMFLFLIAHRVAWPAQSRTRTQSSSCPFRVCKSGLVGTHERDHKARSRTRAWISVTNRHIQIGPNNSRKLCQLPAINLLEALREPSKKLRVRFDP